MTAHNKVSHGVLADAVKADIDARAAKAQNLNDLVDKPTAQKNLTGFANSGRYVCTSTGGLLAELGATESTNLDRAASSGPVLFETRALAEAWAPMAAPDYIETAFFDSSQVAGSGALYRKNGTNTGDLVITQTDATAVGYDIADMRPRIASYGAVNTVDDKQTILDAFSAVTEGGGITLPDGINLNFANGVGSGATLADKRADAVANGGLRAIDISTSHFTFECNGVIRGLSALDDMLRFSGSNVKLTGQGRIENTSGDFNAATSSDPTVQWRATLVKMTGDNCEVFGGLTFRDQPTYGLWMNGNKAKVCGLTFEGGPQAHEVGEFTVQMSLFMGDLVADRYGSIATGCHFQRRAGGAAYSAIFNTCRDAIITGNHVENMLEHGIYSYGDGSIIGENIIDDNLSEMLASAIQCFSQYTTLFGNQLKGSNNNISLQRMSGSRIIGNKAGVITLRKYVGDANSDVLTDIQIVNNDLTAPAGQFWPIDVTVGQPIDGLLIEGNRAKGGGDSFGTERGVITVNVLAAASTLGKRVKVINNTISGSSTFGLLGRRLDKLEVRGNTITDTGNADAARFYDCTLIDYKDNDIEDTRGGSAVIDRIMSATTANGNTVGDISGNSITGKATTGAMYSLPTGYVSARRNRKGRLPTAGRFIFPISTASFVVDSSVDPAAAGIQAGARVNIEAYGTAAVDMQKSAKAIAVTAVATGQFTVATSDGSNSSSAAEFFWEVLQ